MDSPTFSTKNFSMISDWNEDPPRPDTLPRSQGTYPISPCKAPGFPRCVPEVHAPPAETLWKFIDLPLVRKTKLFYCKPPPPPETTPKKISQEYEVEEEEEEETSDLSSPPTMVEELQLEDVLAEVQRISGRVGQLNRELGTRIPECPDIDPCVDMDVELQAFNTSPDILELQRNNHKLRQQLAELQLCRMATDRNIKDIRQFICQEMELADRLQKRLNQLDSFKRKLEREQMLCLQRFRHVERVKVDGGECNNYFSSEQKLMESYLDRLVTKVDYQEQKRRVYKDIDYLKLKAKKLYDHMYYAIGKLNAVMGTDVQMETSELATFLEHNEKLFGPCTQNL